MHFELDLVKHALQHMCCMHRLEPEPRRAQCTYQTVCARLASDPPSPSACPASLAMNRWQRIMRRCLLSRAAGLVWRRRLRRLAAGSLSQSRLQLLRSAAVGRHVLHRGPAGEPMRWHGWLTHMHAETFWGRWGQDHGWIAQQRQQLHSQANIKLVIQPWHVIPAAAGVGLLACHRRWQLFDQQLPA